MIYQDGTMDVSTAKGIERRRYTIEHERHEVPGSFPRHMPEHSENEIVLSVVGSTTPVVIRK